MKLVIVDKDYFESNIRGTFGGEYIDTIMKIFAQAGRGTYLYKPDTSLNPENKQ